jgi:hypothetical protein
MPNEALQPTGPALRLSDFRDIDVAFPQDRESEHRVPRLHGPRAP